MAVDVDVGKVGVLVAEEAFRNGSSEEEDGAPPMRLF